MKIKDLVGLSHSVKVDHHDGQAITRYLMIKIDKEEQEERLQGATVPAQRQAAPEEPSPGVTQEVPEL
jgi:hypothetical protein